MNTYLTATINLRVIGAAIAVAVVFAPSGCGNPAVPIAKGRPESRMSGSQRADGSSPNGSSGRDKHAPPLKLEAVVSRVSRGPTENPGWVIQAISRTVRQKNLPNNNSLGLALDAYRRGASSWRDADGAMMNAFDVLGLPPIEWSDKRALPEWEGLGAESKPVIRVEKENDGVRVGFGTPIASELYCTISFLVITNKPPSSQAAGLDYLACQVDIAGGTIFDPKPSSLMKSDTFLDFWNSKKNTRYTITEWTYNPPGGHIAAQGYGPLLFEVIDSEPDFMFFEDQKITLSRRFRAGCREVCDKVLDFRKAQGQMEPPACRAP